MHDYEKETMLIVNALGELEQTKLKTVEARYIANTLKTIACNMSNLVKASEVDKLVKKAQKS